MGAQVTLTVIRPGYVPRGAGIIQLTVTPAADGLRPLMLTDPGTVRDVHGAALSSHLSQRRVSERMASFCEARITEAGLGCEIERLDDTTALHAGAMLAVWAESTTGSRWCADRAGAPGRTSEAIGKFVAAAFLGDLRSGATVDRHLADQLVLFAALARGTSRYVVPSPTTHLTTNLWLIGQVGARATIDRQHVTIEGIARGPAIISPAGVASERS
jgi:RNA 3'-terminal phosphate cyclase (ATP)